MDRARTQTDKKLNQMEREIGRIYEHDPALIRIEREYAKYMTMVKKRTEASYKAYVRETDWDIKMELKKAYSDEVRALTLDSAEYKKLIKKITIILAEVNQKALDVSNKAMREIYAMNYNQVAVDCKKAGIKVNGKE